MPANSMFPLGGCNYMQNSQLKILASPCIMRQEGLMHLDQACVDVMKFCSSGEQVPINTLK